MDLFIVVWLIAFIIVLRGIYLTQVQIRMLHEEGYWIRDKMPEMIQTGYLSATVDIEELHLKTFLRKKDLDSQYYHCLFFPWDAFETKPLEEYYKLPEGNR